MKKIYPFFLFLFLSIGSVYTQSIENEVFTIAARIKIHLPEQNMASLFSEGPRYIQVGIEGYDKDREYMAGTFDRYIIRDQELVTSVEMQSIANEVQFSKFYLAPQADANDFQYMLELLKITQFYQGGQVFEINHFSNMVYAWIKTNTRKS